MKKALEILMIVIIVVGLAIMASAYVKMIGNMETFIFVAVPFVVLVVGGVAADAICHKVKIGEIW